MLQSVQPKLPMRNIADTKKFYQQAGFRITADHGNYLIVQQEGVEIHFFEFKDLDPKENYGQIYIRTDGIDEVYQQLQQKSIAIHPNGKLEIKPWGQKEFSILDPDSNLITFGETMKRS